jgi:hypothetical protein
MRSRQTSGSSRKIGGSGSFKKKLSKSNGYKIETRARIERSQPLVIEAAAGVPYQKPRE